MNDCWLTHIPSWLFQKVMKCQNVEWIDVYQQEKAEEELRN